MNKPVWRSDDTVGSVREYADWLNDNARTMFLADHAHMEIIFLLMDDGHANTVPVPVEQNREDIHASIVEQVRQDGILAVIQIQQRMISIPDRVEPNPVEAVVLNAQIKEASPFMLVNEITETDDELSLEPVILIEEPEAGLADTFFG